ncbi:MAG: hypothetical protein RIQ60_73 [Pseudomonadota bacterium]|jgi:hypothetical protein
MARPLAEWPRGALPSAGRLLAWIAVASALAATFCAYLQPALMVDLANRLWTCF